MPIARFETPDIALVNPVVNPEKFSLFKFSIASAVSSK